MIFRILIILFFIAVIVIFLARGMEKGNIFFPSKYMSIDPANAGFEYENVYFNTSDGKKIHGWYFPNKENKRGLTVLFCHGNAGNIEHRLEKITMLHDIGLNVFIFDYRGYGKSAGSPDEEGVYKDADGAYLYLKEKREISAAKIILYGESIGGAVAVDLAKREKVGSLITEGAFTSIKDMTRIVYPFLPHFILSTRFDTLSKIGFVKCPKLIIHSQDDEIVPVSMAAKLFNVSKDPKLFVKIRGGHNTAFSDSKKTYKESIGYFIAGLSYETV